MTERLYEGSPSSNRDTERKRGMRYNLSVSLTLDSSPGRGATGESVAAVLDEQNFCFRKRLGSAAKIHSSNPNTAANEDRARRLAPDWACANSRAGPTCQGLPYQGSWHREAMTERFVPLKYIPQISHT